MYYSAYPNYYLPVENLPALNNGNYRCAAVSGGGPADAQANGKLVSFGQGGRLCFRSR